MGTACTVNEVHTIFSHLVVQGRKWWQSGDSPWQVLACCMEITDAIRSHDPECFVSHIPVHQVCDTLRGCGDCYPGGDCGL